MTWSPIDLRRRAVVLGAGVLLVVPAAASRATTAYGSSSPAFVQSTGSTTASNVALTKPVSAGDLLVAGITTNDGGTEPITGVSDTLNGAWTRAASIRYGNGHVELYYLGNAAAGATSVTVAGGRGAITLAEYSGARGLDQVVSRATTTSPAAGPTATLAAAGELVVGIGGMTAPGSFSAGTGFTQRVSAVSNYLYASGLEDLVATSTAAQSMSMRSSTSGYAGGVVAAFASAPPVTPTAALTVSPGSGAAPLGVTADASASTDPIGIASYTFSFGDGSPPVGPQPGATATHTYAAGGTFTVTVTVTDTGGAADSATRTLKVGAPVAALTVSPSSGAVPLAVTANASASTDPVGIASYTFTFGDGASAGPQVGSQATHSYAAGGTYTVRVTVTDTVGATSTASRSVTAVTPPSAALTVAPSSGTAPLFVTADASGSAPGTNPIASYTFAFGDGTTVGPQAAAQATHTYGSGGSYTVTVTVTDSVGMTATATRSVTAVTPPSAALTVTPPSGPVPLAVAADASASTAGTNPIAAYTFAFGDGTTVGPQAAAQASHTYTAAGAYTVTVTVTDTVGTASTATRTVTAATPPSAALAVTPSTGTAPLPVTADASGSTPGTYPIATYTFTFGDGTTVGPQAGAQATHTYGSGGSYSVTVAVTDSIGTTATAAQSVTAVSSPTARLTVTPASGTTPLGVTADASTSSAGTNPIASYSFAFGDGITVGPQALAQASHTYTVGGAYTVTVTVSDSAGTTSTASRSVTAVSPPSAALTVTPTSGTIPLAVTADASASTAGSDPIVSYTFTFGDGTVVGPQPGAQATHTFGTAGAFTVSVTVTDSVGTTATTARTVTATAPPTAALQVTPASGTTPLSVTADASASSAGSNPIGTYTFDFGDGTVVGPQGGAQAKHTYNVGGTYAVTVTVADTTGATATTTRTVSAVTPPSAALSVTPPTGSVPLAVTADATGSTARTNPIASFTFDFGDGAVAGPQATAVAHHTYASGGTFTATVTVTDSVGTTATATAAVRAVAPPAASLTVTPSSGALPLAVIADASASTAGSNPIATYTFNFGDGTVTGPQAGPQASHSYSVAGTYSVTVTVADGSGNSATAARAVVAETPPTAAVNATPTTGAAPLAVGADASASTAGSSPIATYTFNFGDGTAAVGPQAGVMATHVYSVSGSYTITVTVVDSIGVSATATAAVSALAPPTASLAVSPTSGYAPLTVAASGGNSAAGSNPIATYTFNFGDGTVVGPQSSPAAGHTYVGVGSVAVTLTVTDTQGYTGAATASVTVSSGVLAQDTFQRPNQSGWGTASNGATWSTGTGLSVSANEGVMSYSGASQFERLGTATIADANGLVRFSVAASSDAVGIILRAQANGNMDLGRYDGAGHLQFEYRVGSSWTHVSLVNFSPTPNTFYWLRFEVQGPNVFLKAWPSGTAEPAPWNWSGTGNGITSAGQMGLYGYAGSNATEQLDSFTASAVGNPAPNSTITGTVTDSTNGAAISGVTVSTLPVTTTATTNATGAYSLAIPAGTYSVVFAAWTTGHNANVVNGVQAPANGSVAVPNQPLVPIPPQTAMDTFTQPDQTNGWGTSTDGNIWSSDLGVYPGAQGGITNGQSWADTQSSTTADLDTWMGYQYQNQEVRVDLNITSYLVDPNFQHGARVLARVQNSTTWVLMTVNPNAQDLELWATLNNSWTLLTAVSQPISTNAWYHVKLDVIGTLAQGKIWAFGATEPGWLISATQTAVSGTGQGGVRTTGAYVQYANFMQSPITQISGTVTSSSTGAPVANATVSVGGGIATVTDARGNYTLSGLVGGRSYTVSASAPGFQGASASVTPATATSATANLVLTG